MVLERELFIDNLLVRTHFIIAMIRRTGLAPWEFEFPFPGSLTSTFLRMVLTMQYRAVRDGGAGLRRLINVPIRRPSAQAQPPSPSRHSRAGTPPSRPTLYSPNHPKH